MTRSGRSTPLRVLVAPDKFKGTLTAREAADAMAAGVRDVFPDAMIDACPIADGGEGTLDALEGPLGLSRRTSRVIGPLGEPVDAAWGVNVASRVAVIELAQAAGLWRVPFARRDPTRSTTAGVATLVLDAVAAGATRVLVGLGGSATCDGGCGVAQGLGAAFIGASGERLSMAAGPRDAALLVARIESAPRPATIEALCDVDNVLLGPRGAARAFGPQKGATPEDVQWLEAALEGLARVPVDGRDVSDLAVLPGAGAAGGAGFGLAAWCGATLRRGAEVVLDAVGFDRRAAEADLVVTGEGRLDRTTLEGKAVGCVARRAAAMGRPVVAIVGATESARVVDGTDSDGAGPGAPAWWRDVRIAAIVDELGEPAALRTPFESLRETTRRMLRRAADGMVGAQRWTRA